MPQVWGLIPLGYVDSPPALHQAPGVGHTTDRHINRTKVEQNFAFFIPQGLFRRAEALRKALQSPQWRPGVPPNLGFGDVINDYCACHALKPDVKSLCEAIIVAVDQGNNVFYMHQYLTVDDAFICR